MGAEEIWVDEVSVYGLFELDADEYIDYQNFRLLNPSPLAKKFKKTILEAYNLFLIWKEDNSTEIMDT